MYKHVKEPNAPNAIGLLIGLFMAMGVACLTGSWALPGICITQTLSLSFLAFHAAHGFLSEFSYEGAPARRWLLSPAWGVAEGHSCGFALQGAGTRGVSGIGGNLPPFASRVLSDCKEEVIRTHVVGELDVDCLGFVAAGSPGVGPGAPRGPAGSLSLLMLCLSAARNCPTKGLHDLWLVPGLSRIDLAGDGAELVVGLQAAVAHDAAILVVVADSARWGTVLDKDHRGLVYGVGLPREGGGARK